MFGYFGNMGWPADEITLDMELGLTNVLSFKLIEEAVFFSVKWALVVFIDGKRFDEAVLFREKPKSFVLEELAYIKQNKLKLCDKNIDVVLEYTRRGGQAGEL